MGVFAQFSVESLLHLRTQSNSNIPSKQPPSSYCMSVNLGPHAVGRRRHYFQSKALKLLLCHLHISLSLSSTPSPAPSPGSTVTTPLP